MKKLTIGSPVYDDYEGVFFTYQSLRLNNMDIWDDLDLVIIDNNPDSAEGNATRQFCDSTQHIRYFPYTERLSNSVKNEIFKHAEGEFCMSIDCHILFEPDAISNLISFLGENKSSDDLYHGPMFYDVIQGHDPCSKMDPVWRGDMFGIWATDKRGNGKHNDPFEIEMHGCGVFLARTESWLGFNEDFQGFGGEEGYIHTKYKQDGRKVWCLPFLRWVHRFNRPRGVPYPLAVEDKIRNYLIGHEELGLPFDAIIEHFGETQPNIDVNALIKDLGKDPSSKTESVPASIPQKTLSSAPTETSSIKFNTPQSIKYLKVEFFSDCRLNSISISPSTIKGDRIRPTLVSHSPIGIRNPEGPFSSPPSSCSVSQVDGFKEITFELDKVIQPSSIILAHDAKSHIIVYASVDGEGWSIIGEINS
jgi:hypothetical protein